MSQLGQELSRLRIQKNWNQGEAAKKCSVNPSIFSRIESGKIEKPQPRTLLKLAKGFNISLEKLLSLTPNDDGKFRVGFAHCLWAAPVIPLVMDGPTSKGMKLTSYGAFQPADCFEYKPFWYESDAISPFNVGPSYGYNQSTLPQGYIQHPKNSKHSTYSALDLDRLLKNQDLDCIIAARHVFASHDSMILHCARIMDQAGGGKAILVWKKEGKYNSTFTKFRKIDVVLLTALEQALKTENRKLNTFYGQGTSVEQTLEFFGKTAINRFEKKPVLLRDWPLVLKQLKDSYDKDGAFLFLGWEPLIFNIQRAFPRAGIKTRIHLSVEKPMPYLSFDIMFSRADAKKWIDSEVVQQFLKQINLAIEQLKTAIATQKLDAPIIQQIASYLDMDSAVCLDALSHIDFGLLYYPEWLEYKDSLA